VDAFVELFRAFPCGQEIGYFALSQWKKQADSERRLQKHLLSLRGKVGYDICAELLELFQSKKRGETFWVVDVGETGQNNTRAVSYRDDHGGSGGKASWILHEAFGHSFERQIFLPVAKLPTSAGKKHLAATDEAELWVFTLAQAFGFEYGKATSGLTA
jgi:hypothetical protein